MIETMVECSVRMLILVVSLAVVFPAEAVWTQTAGPNEMGVSKGHLHWIVSDVDAARKFGIAMAIVPVEFGQEHAVRSLVNYFGFSVPSAKSAPAKEEFYEC
jgi:hypothetical protein